MSVYKDTKNNTWKVYYRFTDWQGKVHQSTNGGCPVLAIGIKKTCVSDWKEGYIDEHASGNI